MQYWSTTTVNLLFTLLLFTLVGSLKAQENSPYSRYGIGTLKTIENIANRGMGGVSIADNNTLITNPSNPATYTGLKMTSYQLGLEAASVNVKNSTAANRTGYATLSYINVGMPLSKKIGASFGLIPVSRSKYSMEHTSTLPFTSVTNSYYGGGGTQKIYVGAAYRMGDFSLGLNTGYLFGNLVNTTDNKFEDTLKIFSNSVSTRTTLGGVFWQLGAHYVYNLKDDYQLKIGATYTGAQSLNARKEAYWQTYFGEISDPLYTKQVDSVANVKGKVKLPAHLGFGIILANGDYWQVGGEVNYADWSRYTSYGNSDSMTNSLNIKLGASITPDVNSVNSYLKRVTYRAGGFVGNENLIFNGTKLPKLGVSVGAGFPIRRTNMSIGQINASLEIGKRGTTNQNLLQENYTRFSIGLTLNDKWFIKRKYD